MPSKTSELRRRWSQRQNKPEAQSGSSKRRSVRRHVCRACAVDSSWCLKLVTNTGNALFPVIYPRLPHHFQLYTHRSTNACIIRLISSSRRRTGNSHKRAGAVHNRKWRFSIFLPVNPNAPHRSWALAWREEADYKENTGIGFVGTIRLAVPVLSEAFQTRESAIRCVLGTLSDTEMQIRDHCPFYHPYICALEASRDCG